ncbi:hypothetical protein Tcan_00198, partial [Toxocara canis]
MAIIASVICQLVVFTSALIATIVFTVLALYCVYNYYRTFGSIDRGSNRDVRCLISIVVYVTPANIVNMPVIAVVLAIPIQHYFPRSELTNSLFVFGENSEYYSMHILTIALALCTT